MYSIIERNILWSIAAGLLQAYIPWEDIHFWMKDHIDK